MAGSDFFSSSEPNNALDPEAYGVGAVGAGAAIDTRGWRWAVFDLIIGDSAGTYTFQVEEDDNSGFSSAADVSGATASVTATDDDSVKRVVVDCQQRERYLRVKAGTVATGVVDLSCCCNLYLAKDTGNTAAATPDATVLT